MFLLMFMVHLFDVLNILIGHIVFYRFVIGGAYYGTYSLSFTTSFAVHIFCFHIFIVIFSPIQGFQGGSLLPKSGVCFGYLFFKWVNDILDMVSYNRNKFMLSMIIVSKEMMKTSV